MLLVKVPEPPVFRAPCLDCRDEGKVYPGIVGQKYADLDGPAFKSYYCEPHANVRIHYRHLVAQAVGS